MTDKNDMNAFKHKYFPSQASLEDHLTVLYYRFTGRQESRSVPCDHETGRRVDEYYREFCLKLENIFGKGIVARLRGGKTKDDAEIEKIEETLLDDEAALALYEAVSSENAIPADSIIANIKSSFEYGMEFLHTFNIIHGIIPEENPIMEIAANILHEENDKPISEDILPVLAASSASFAGEPGYVWHHKALAGMESSLYRIGQDDYRFILHVKKGSSIPRRIKIVIENPGNNETVLSAEYPVKKGNVILNYRGPIDDKTIIKLKVHKIAQGDM
jgi:hypothetical protein